MMALALRPRESRVSRFRGAPAAELLASESDGVVRLLELALQRLLELTPATSDALNPHTATAVRRTPVLTLQLFPRAERRQMGDAERVQALSAFALLAAHSRRLRDHPTLKRAFWLDVLQSRMPYESTRHVPKAALREPEFPIFVVDFRGQSFFRHDVTPPPFTLLEDAIVSFFSTLPLPHLTLPDASGPDALAFELSFAGSSLTSVDALEAVERVLDRVFAHPTRQFAVSALDLSRNRMGTAELAVVARVAHKCRYAYRVSELRLDEIIPGVVSSGYQCPDATPREFLDIMHAAYGVGRAPLLTHPGAWSSVPVPKNAAALRSVSFKGNYVCPAYFAALYSSLRYGSPIDADSSEYTARPTKGLPEKTECRSWLAFGLFYPRPRRFAQLLDLRDVGRLECSSEVVEAFAKTLRNPTAQLASRAVDGHADAVTSELMVCTVKSGASVELIRLEQEPKRRVFGSFEPPSAPSEPEIREIGAQCELEGLCEREADGAVCVVVPGVGLGWVQRDAVERIEREPLASAWTQLEGRYAVQLACAYSSEGVEAMKAMLALLGRQIRSLSFDCYRFDLSIVPQILAHCPHLRHLSLQSINLPSSDLAALLDALRTSPLRAQLLTLNLNDSSVLRDAEVQQLAAVLASESSYAPLALRELRLHGAVLGIDTVVALSSALDANRRLRLLQLLRVDSVRNRYVHAEQTRLSAAHDEQLLQRALPPAAKRAFLSVAGHAMDTHVLALILQFAAGRDERRAIAWTSNIRCGSY